MPSPSTIYELDLIVRRFLKAGAKDKNLLNEVKNLATTKYKEDPKFEDKADFYIKVADKVKEQGIEYVEKETKRLQSVMNNKMTEEQRATLHDKFKILLVFGDT